MARTRIELNKNEKALLEVTAAEMIPMLVEEADAISVKQSAYDYYNESTKEHFQVQVIVTRRDDEFLEFLQVEVLKNY